MLILQNKNVQKAVCCYNIFDRSNESSKVRLNTLPLTVRQGNEVFSNRLKHSRKSPPCLTFHFSPVTNVQCVSGIAVLKCLNCHEATNGNCGFCLLLLTLYDCQCKMITFKRPESVLATLGEHTKPKYNT